MAENITRDIQFKSQSTGKTNPAEMHVVAYSPHERKVRAIKSLVIFWVIAILCVPILIAHFILVPGFFIGGIVVASRRWKAEEEGRDATGICPACDEETCVTLDKNPELPQWHDCPKCSSSLELRAAAQTEPEEAKQA